MILGFEQYSDEWWSARFGIPTASAFSMLLTPAKLEPSRQLDDYAKILAAEKWSQQRVDAWTGNAYTDNGHAMEDTARAFYEVVTGQEVQQVGLLRSEKIEAAASPDGLVEGGCLEIKNCGAKQHIKCLSESGCPRDYFLQCQGQILVGWEDGVRWVDLLLYSETLPIKIIRVDPVQKAQDALAKQIERICKERDRYLEIIARAA